MAKELNQWLDEFVQNGADASDVTNWPENAGGGGGGDSSMKKFNKLINQFTYEEVNSLQRGELFLAQLSGSWLASSYTPTVMYALCMLTDIEMGASTADPHTYTIDCLAYTTLPLNGATYILQDNAIGKVRCHLYTRYGMSVTFDYELIVFGGSTPGPTPSAGTKSYLYFGGDLLPQLEDLRGCGPTVQCTGTKLASLLNKYFSDTTWSVDNEDKVFIKFAGEEGTGGSYNDFCEVYLKYLGQNYGAYSWEIGYPNGTQGTFKTVTISNDIYKYNLTTQAIATMLVEADQEMGCEGGYLNTGSWQFRLNDIITFQVYQGFDSSSCSPENDVAKSISVEDFMNTFTFSH